MSFVAEMIVPDNVEDDLGARSVRVSPFCLPASPERPPLVTRNKVSVPKPIDQLDTAIAETSLYEQVMGCYQYRSLGSAHAAAIPRGFRSDICAGAGRVST